MGLLHQMGGGGGLYVTGQVNYETLQAEQTVCTCVLGGGERGVVPDRTGE